ncbi:MAG TPA: hypothetical protein VND93_13230 [Myxococcales bacterium]|nr:hypothetical protein [Myxococcales bacterium]
MRQFLLAVILGVGFPTAALAQQAGFTEPPQQQPQQPPPEQQPPPPPDGTATTPPPADGTASPAPPPGDALATQPQPGLEAAPQTPESITAPPPEALLDGHLRSGPFLAGPGSLTFILHNSLLGAMGGFGTQLISNRFDFIKAKEGLLVGTLVGAGIGFGISTWWQFTHWMDRPVAGASLANALYAGMLAAGLVDSLSSDYTALAWSAFISAELGGWLTAAIGGGELRSADALAISSAGGWAAAWAALVLATMTYSGGTAPSSKVWVDALLITPGLGAAATALALVQIHPTANQVIRGDLFGLGVGGVVLVVSGLVVGFQTPTPYVLSLLSSAGALAAVSIFWEEAAEKPGEEPQSWRWTGGRKLASKKPYNNPWW